MKLNSRLKIETLENEVLFEFNEMVTSRCIEINSVHGAATNMAEHNDRGGRRRHERLLQRRVFGAHDGRARLHRRREEGLLVR